MSKMRSGRAGRAGVTSAAVPRVLPRPLRPFVRYATKMLDGTIEPPRHIGTTGALGFLAATLIYGAQLGGHLDGTLSSGSARVGLAVDAIKIAGHSRTQESQVIQALRLDEHASIVTFNVNEARERMLSWPWIKTVDIAKAYPGSVLVELTEKEAAAIWQNGQQMQALDADGEIIGPAVLAADRSLPAFVGQGAQKRGLAFAQHVRELAPTVAKHVRAHVLVAERRWDLVLRSGLVVRLPENGLDPALITLEAMARDEMALERDLTAIDLRIASRPTVTLGETALEELAERWTRDGKTPGARS